MKPPPERRDEIDAFIARRRENRFFAPPQTLAEDLQPLWPGVTALDVARYLGTPARNQYWLELAERPGSAP